MAHVIVARDDIAVRCEEAREGVIAADVLGDAVDELDDSLRLRFGLPEQAVQLPAARRRQIKSFHCG